MQTRYLASALGHKPWRAHALRALFVLGQESHNYDFAQLQHIT